MPLIESVAAAGLTISELNSELVKAYQGRFLVQPAFMIRPVQADSRLSELRAAVEIAEQALVARGLLFPWHRTEQCKLLDSAMCLLKV